MKKSMNAGFSWFVSRTRACALLGLLAFSGKAAHAGPFTGGNLLFSYSTYSGTASTVTVGQTLPGGGTAIANGTFPYVFNNATVDSSFGVTSPIYLQQITQGGAFVNPAIDVTAATGIVTSFSSKSELSLNVSTNGQSVTFMGYASTPNQLDVSNSNTPGIIEPGNPVTTTPTYRAVVQLNSDGTLKSTTTNAYAGNNGRAAIYDATNNQYLTVGNAGNGNGSAQVTAATGVQIVTPGQNATPAAPGTTQVGSFNITQVTNPSTGKPYTADKSAKDNNYRGETIFDNTLYVTKGSGSNGINTVYQVGNAGTLPTAANAASAPITILPGMPTILAKGNNLQSSAPNDEVMHPFGLFFANANTLYVGDEGDGGSNVFAKTNKYAGLQKWSLVSGTWKLDYTLTNNLITGTTYSPAGYPTGVNSATGANWAIETDGLRDIAGQVNANGTVTIWGVTSTVSGSGDNGADPNMIVDITDNLAATTLPGSESFSVLEGPVSGEVYRGVSFVPTPEPGTFALILAGVPALALGWYKRRRAARG